MSLNLNPPPGFRGLNPHKPLRIYTRNLPHWRQPGATYFVTFNLNDSLPAPRRAELEVMRQEWERQHPPPHDEDAWQEWAKQSFQHVERWMDEGHGACWFRNPEYAAELSRSILHFHQQRYDVGCFVVMANHCHLAVRPFDEIDLEDELGSIKSVTARFINRRESTLGELWQQESYDRIIRDEEHLYRVVQYIGANPQNAGVPQKEWHLWMNPEWESRGWGFRGL